MNPLAGSRSVAAERLKRLARTVALAFVSHEESANRHFAARVCASRRQAPLTHAPRQFQCINDYFATRGSATTRIQSMKRLRTSEERALSAIILPMGMVVAYGASRSHAP